MSNDRGVITLAPGEHIRVQGPKPLKLNYDKARSYYDVTAPGTYVPPTPPPTTVVYPFPANGTQAQFLAALADLTVDVIELPTATYHWNSTIINITRPTRPLIVRPAAGASVIFKGDKATSQGGQFYFGLGGKASDLHFEFAGVTFDGYTLGSTGIVWMGAVQRVTFNGPTVQNSTGIGINSWACYLSVDAGASPQDTYVDGWTVRGVGRSMSALQVGHPPSTMANIRARHWVVDSCDIAIYAYGVVNGLTIDDWAITNSQRDDRDGTVYFGPQVTGVYSNMHSDLGNLESQGGMTRGPGNVGI